MVDPVVADTTLYCQPVVEESFKQDHCMGM